MIVNCYGGVFSVWCCLWCGLVAFDIRWFGMYLDVWMIDFRV